MTRATYLNLRNSNTLSQNKSAVCGHVLREGLLLGFLFLSWNSNFLIARAFCAPVIAALVFRNFAIMHDAVHRSASKIVWLNDVIGIICGGICFLPFEQWRRSHLEHHTWSGNLDKDPVTAFVTIFPKLPKRTQNVFNFFWKCWFPLLAIIQHLVFWSLAFKVTASNKNSMKLFVSALSPIVFWGSVIKLLPSGFLVGGVAPGIVLYLLLVEIVNLPHHLELPQYRGEKRLHLWEQYEVARTCIYPKWFTTWVVVNFNFHTEHHLFPDVPWYRLSGLHQSVKASAGQAYNCDNRLGWMLRNRSRTINEILNNDRVQSENKAA